MSKLSKESKPRNKQSPVSGGKGSVPEKGVHEMQLPVHDIRVPEHIANSSNYRQLQRGRKVSLLDKKEGRTPRIKSPQKEVKSIKHFCIDPQENLRRVLEARRHG